ncbi:MAG: UDP-N-acetylmuramyl-tripeptide synthetase [Eubacteriales bacterium]|nr:UDP-N-acetylmuramyl-tripeptide synthetase [Eubacteriales bacterium]MDD4389640.1 UDP-N-acetylmuramyl-tripeptide synthetase [Eubacteriales bacterium]
MTDKFHALKKYRDILAEMNLLTDDNLSAGMLPITVKSISCDSRDVTDGTLFVCKGVGFKEEFLRTSLEAGACCYISEQKYEEYDVPYIIVRDVRNAMTYIASLYYNDVWKNINLVGITGTKGKSTTTYFQKYIFDDFLNAGNRPKSAVISSIDTYDGVVEFESHITTPETFDLYKHFDNAVSSNINYLTMEVSSQALKYDRTLGITFDVGCYLNIGIDHISDIEHSDFEDYFSAKLKLLEQCNTAVVNVDCEYAQRVLNVARKNAKNVITFGTSKNADVRGYDVRITEDQLIFRACCEDFDEEFSIGLHGLFNVQNALTAISISHALNIPVEFIKSGLKKARVSGRMEIFRAKNCELFAIVDYAHNKMSFEALFESTRKQYPGRPISIVFGCPGYKALGRRRELGEIAGKYAEMSYITEEDAGAEPVMQISEEIASHIREQGGKYEIIEDRREAIKAAVQNAPDNGIILITGKGRETRQKRGKEYIETPSDVDFTEEFLYSR